MVSTVLSDDELCAYQNPFPSDIKMLCFSLEVNENQNMVRDSQLLGSDIHSQAAAGFSNPQNYSSLSMTPMRSSVTVAQPGHIDPPMGQNLAMHNGLGGQQKNSKARVDRYFWSRAYENMGISGASQVRSFWHGCSTNTANEESSSLHYACTDTFDHNLIPRPKKLKTSLSYLPPWHKEIKGIDKLGNISTAEMDWAQLTNRLIEVEDKAQINKDGLPMPRARRRLVLTTQLMHQLLPAVPQRILTADATSEYEGVIHLVAKLALGDACGRISCSRRDFNIPFDRRNMISETLKTTGSVGEQFFSEVVEESIGRVRNLENDLSRLEKRASISDIRVECQQLERSSIINRFAKFHGQGQVEGVESLLTSENAPDKMFPQGYIAALSMPGNPPEGIVCLSL